MKWFIIILTIVVLYAIMTDNMGGAKDAAANYNKLLRNTPAADKGMGNKEDF